MNIVAVTSCPTGIAHTYMAAAQWEKAAKKLGHSIKVETQGSMGIENEITADDIKGAQVAIFAAEIAVRNRDRFDGMRIVEISVQDAIKSAETIIAKINQ
jgi:fructose-specific phosphotransferase system IIB component